MSVQVKQEQAYAYAEILEILSYMEENYTSKIPKKLMTIFQDNALSTYENHLDRNIPLQEQKISKKTSALIAVLTVQYWCESKEQKKELLTIFEENERKYQEELRKKYNPDNIFNNKEQQVMNNIDQTFDEIDEIDRVSQEESIKAQERAIEIEKRKEMEEQILSQKNALIDYNSFPWYKKAFTKIKVFILNIFKGKKNAA
jgi:hypothetical protein